MNEIQRTDRKSQKSQSEEKELDQLTGILKKNIAEERMASRMRGRRDGALFLCDVDNLERINEQYGHLAGDECLKQVAQILSYMIHPNDVFGRYGGDEFMIFVPDCADMEVAQEILERIEKRFRDNRGRDRSRIPLSVTAVWVLRQQGDTCQGLLERADAELKKRKVTVHIQGKEIGKEKDRYAKDVRQIRKELMEEIRKPGAYCQDYETFRGIYRFIERGILRSGQKVCVILLTVVNEQGESLMPHEKDVLMEQLGETIGTALRIGDVYTRYSSSQYLVLVIDATEGQADVIVDRIKKQFLASTEGNDILLHHCYEMQPARIKN